MHHKPAVHYRSLAEMPSALADLVEACAFDHGRVYDSYLVIEQPREYFFASGWQGCVGFTRHGRYAHIVGGLLAPAEDRETLLAEFLAFAREERLHVTFYNLLADEAPLFRAAGFQVTKWGEDPLVDLKTTAWKGKAFEWLRRQENYCRRQDVEIEEVVADPANPDYCERISPALREVSQSHLEATRHGRELRTFVSQFDPLLLGRRRLWIARRQGRYEAFIVCNPSIGGAEWSVETYRRRDDATRGIVPALMMAAMRQMQQEGVSSVSLCLIPCLRCDEPTPDDSPMVRRGLSFWWRCGNWLFDMRGIYHYKSRFRPTFRPLYIAASPRITIGSMKSCLRIWEVCRPNPAALVRGVRQWFGKLADRRSLATPGESLATPVEAQVMPAAKKAKPVEQPVTQAVDVTPNTPAKPTSRNYSTTIGRESRTTLLSPLK
jgi:phosphatidylglycerol lysyltransferase